MYSLTAIKINYIVMINKLFSLFIQYKKYNFQEIFYSATKNKLRKAPFFHTYFSINLYI